MFNIHRFNYILFIVPIVFLLNACTPETAAENPGFVKADTLDESLPTARLILGSDSLVGKVRMANVKLRKVGTLTQAQIAIQNLSDDRQKLEYRIEWEDESGFIVDQSGVWRQVILSPSQIDTISTTAKKPEAEKVIINLRNPDKPFLSTEKQEINNTNQSSFGE